MTGYQVLRARRARVVARSRRKKRNTSSTRDWRRARNSAIRYAGLTRRAMGAQCRTRAPADDPGRRWRCPAAELAFEPDRTRNHRQLDIGSTWSTSTDDTGVTGYQVLRGRLSVHAGGNVNDPFLRKLRAHREHHVPAPRCEPSMPPDRDRSVEHGHRDNADQWNSGRRLYGSGHGADAVADGLRRKLPG